MDNTLKRRAAFWDNWRYRLEKEIEEFSAPYMAEKWTDDADNNDIHEVCELLNDALFIVMKRYHEVLGMQIHEINLSKFQREASNETVILQR